MWYLALPENYSCSQMGSAPLSLARARRIFMRHVLLLLILSSTQALVAQSLQYQMNEMRMQIQQLRQEIEDLKKQVRTQQDVTEAVPLLQAQVQEQAQTKVETSSRFPFKIFGSVISNTFWNSGEPNWLDLPNIATAGIAGLRTGSFRSALRQTRVGGIFEGPTIGGMKLNGAVAMDFYGGIPNFQTGEVVGLPRLLYAYMRLDGEKTAIEI